MAPCCSPDPSSTEQARAHTTSPSSKGLETARPTSTNNKLGRGCNMWLGFRTPSQLLSALSSSKGSVDVGAKA